MSHKFARTLRAMKVAILLTGAALASDCTTGATADGHPAATTPASDSVMIVEAKAFMNGYAEELRAGDRAAMAKRYDRQGAWMVGNGRALKTSYDSIVAFYAGPAWQPPATFQWKDLAYEPQGANAILVVGEFAWAFAPGTAPIIMSYSALLQHQDGQWRLHLEDESGDPMVMAKVMASMDTITAKAKQK
ncbi:DUF4440 domain-containing protein [Gemmatimonas sp.]|uniref:DUF4440 domain-containing protein n=1 Tax=Gemmatimonas sp. TaxID=1962908 RepID=UPI0039833150